MQLWGDAIVARIWKGPLVAPGAENLDPQSVIFVRVASFTFQFGSVEQLREGIKYYELKTHPGSRIAAKAIAADLGDDWRKLRSSELERWFERLTMYLLEEPKRQKVVKALREALDLVEKGKLCDAELRLQKPRRQAVVMIELHVIETRG
jgi:hypothetical protein